MPTAIPGIYVIRNTPTGKVLVGSSRNVFKRFRYHQQTARRGTHKNPYFQHAWDKHGAESFTYTLVVSCELSDLIAKEDYWMAVLESRDPAKGYNLKAATGREQSAETRAKIAAASRARMTPEARAHLSAIHSGVLHWNYGKKAPAETREKLRVSHLGKTQSPETVAKRAAAMRGHAVSAETRRKISDANRGRVFSAEARAAMSAGRKRAAAAREAAKQKEQISLGRTPSLI